MEPVDHARRRGDQIEVELPVQTLLDDLEVKQAEEAAAEPEPQRRGILRLELEARIVQAQLGQTGPQLLEFGRIRRIQTAEDDRQVRLEPFERLRRRFAVVRHRVAHLAVGHGLDGGTQIPDLARTQAVGPAPLRREHTDLVHIVCRARRHQPHAHAAPQLALPHPHQRDHPEITVVPTVDHHGAAAPAGSVGGRGQPGRQRLEHVPDPQPGLRRAQDGVTGVKADRILDLRAHAVGFGRGQVDLVEDDDDLVVVVDRLVDVGQGLRLDPLGRIHHQKRSLAGRERAVDLVREVDMPGGVDQVQHVIPPVGGPVGEAYRLRLDRDSALALELHAVEHLLAHLALGQSAAGLDQPVGERGLAVVDVGDDGEVADPGEVGHGPAYSNAVRAQQAGASAPCPRGISEGRRRTHSGGAA